MVVRVDSVFAGKKRVQGFLSLQQCGSAFRLLVDGHEVIETTDGSPSAVHLPDVKWEPDTKRVKSANNNSIHGRCTLLTFPSDATGVSAVQVNIMRNNPNEKGVEVASLSFEEAILKASTVSKAVCG